MTVYFSANRTSATQINLAGRTDTSSNVLTLDGFTEQNTSSGSASPSWVATGVNPVDCANRTSPASCGWASISSAAKFTVQTTTPIIGPSGGNDFSNCIGYFTVQGFSFQATEGQSANLAYVHDLTFQFNEVTRIATGSYGPGTYIGPAQHGPCHTGAARPSGTDSGPDNVTVQYNYIHATWGECIYVGASTSDPMNAPFPGCTACQQFEGGPSGTNLACGNGAGSPSNCNTGSNYLIAYNNIESCASWGGQGDGTDVKDGHDNLRIVGNTYRTTKACTSCGSQKPGNDGQGPLLESGTLVADNYIEAPGHQGTPVYASWSNSHGRNDIVLRNNIYVNINSGVGSNTALHLWGPNITGLNIANWHTAEFYNNTIYSAGSASGSPDDCIAIDSQSGGDGSFVSATVENNIIDTCGGNGLRTGISSGITHDYNEFYNISGSATNINGASASCSGSTVSSEKHAMCGDPMFVSTSTPYVDTNFKLQGGSPAVGTGVDLSTVFTDDYFGTTRTVPWDISASGQSSSGTPPNPPTNLAAAVN